MIEKKPQPGTNQRKKIKVLEIRDLFNPAKNKYETRAFYRILEDQEYYDPKTDKCMDGVESNLLIRYLINEYEKL